MRRILMLISVTLAAPSAALAAEVSRISVEVTGYVPVSCRALEVDAAAPLWQCNGPARIVTVETRDLDADRRETKIRPRRIAVIPLI